MNLDRMMRKQAARNPNNFDMKIKLLQFLATRLGLVISWLASFVVAYALAQLVKIGVELDSEIEGALILAINQTLWGALIWAVNTFEMPFKKELQAILGATTIDGLIGPQTVQRAERVKEFAESTEPLPKP
jgi:hypothetical protein